MATEFSAFADLSGVVQSLVKELEGKVLSQTDLIKHLPKFVLVAWTSNLSIDKAEAQILAAVKHLIAKFVPAAQQAAVIGFVDAAFPAIVIALNGLIEQVKAEVLKKATGALGDVGKKVEAVCATSCLPWFFGCLNKVAKEVPAAAPAVAAVETAVAADVPAVVEEVTAAANSDIAEALAPALSSVKEDEPAEAKAE